MNNLTLYTSKEVRKIVGITSQKLEYWILKSIILPYDTSQGTGTYRQFSYSNLVELVIIKALLGMIRVSNLSDIADILESTKSQAPDYFEEDKKFKTIDSQILFLSIRQDKSTKDKQIIRSHVVKKDNAIDLHTKYINKQINHYVFSLDRARYFFMKQLKSLS